MFGMSGWRIIFFVGVLPAILIVPIMLVLGWLAGIGDNQGVQQPKSSDAQRLTR